MSFIKSIKQKAAQVGDVLKKSYGPLSALEPTSNNIETLRYPLDVGNMELYPHTVEFMCWKPEPVDWNQLMGPEADTWLSNLVSYSEDAGKTKPYEPWKDEAKENFGALNLENSNPDSYLGKRAREGLRINRNQQYNGERISDFTRRAELTDIIALYLPSQSLQEAFNNDYSELSMTQALGAAGFLLDAAGSIGESIKGLFGQGDKGGGMADLKPMLIEAAGAGLGGGAADVAQAMIQAGGYATNPQLEILYKGTKFRTFDFRFDMMPRSKKEADEVLKIVKQFKYHASPEYRQAQGRFMVPPSFFDIRINFGGTENTRIPMKLSTCVLTGIDLDMSSGSDQMVSFSDGGPIQITMQLRFTELEIMHKELRKQGY